MPHDLIFKTLNAAHRFTMRASFGKLGWTAVMPVLELTTTGRRSGQRRTVILTSPIQLSSGALVIIASKGGDERHPDWFLNLQANPSVEVSFRAAPPQAMVARIASDEEKAELWPRVVAEYKGYGKYQEKTQRSIPLVFLDPA
jgi:deazaflavin-dependent oxidoreductase (nitroreductase family)